jgi:hypothetical protein
MGSVLSSGSRQKEYQLLGNKNIAVLGSSPDGIHNIYYALIHGVQMAQFITSKTGETLTSTNIEKGRLFLAHKVKIDKYRESNCQTGNWVYDDIVIFVVDIDRVDERTCARIATVIGYAKPFAKIVIALYSADKTYSEAEIEVVNAKISSAIQYMGNDRVHRVVCSTKSEKEFSVLKFILLKFESEDIKAFENKPGFFNCPSRKNVDNVQSWEADV